MKKINKNNFWENTKGTFKIELEGPFHDLIAYAVNNYSSKNMEVNFNQRNDTFYLRRKKFAVRISKDWGSIGDGCEWNLERDPNPKKYQMVIIRYNELIEND